MQKLVKGTYYGIHKEEIDFKDFLTTDTEYTHDRVDWHYHENPYFTFLLQGSLFEANKKESYFLKPGSLLFHNWQDAHYNIKPPEYTRGFHIELTNDWFTRYMVSLSDLEGSIQIENPFVKQQISKIVLETKVNDEFSKSSIELLLLHSLDSIKKDVHSTQTKKPNWVKELKEIIHHQPEICTSLVNLSSHLNIHPVHISRQFPRYFNATLGTYIRTLKINTAVSLLFNRNMSMTDIAYECDFFDQSHFTNSFKSVFKITPLAFRKKTFNVN